MKRWILSLIVIISGSMGCRVWHERSSHDTPQVTITTYNGCSRTATRCMQNALPYILAKTYDVADIHQHLQQIMPHIRDIGARWITPNHVCIQARCDTPQVYVSHPDQAYIITKHGACVPAQYIAKHIRKQLPQLLWNSDASIQRHAEDILHLYNNTPATWWATYAIQWHAPHDIRFHAYTPKQSNIRTASHRTISDTAQKQIQQIQNTYAQQRSQPWIDIRFPRYAVVYQSIRGR